MSLKLRKKTDCTLFLRKLNFIIIALLLSKSSTKYKLGNTSSLPFVLTRVNLVKTYAQTTKL